MPRVYVDDGEEHRSWLASRLAAELEAFEPMPPDSFVSVNLRVFFNQANWPEGQRFPRASFDLMLAAMLDELAGATEADIVSVNAGIEWGNVTGFELRWDRIA